MLMRQLHQQVQQQLSEAGEFGHCEIKPEPGHPAREIQRIPEK